MTTVVEPFAHVADVLPTLMLGLWAITTTLTVALTLVAPKRAERVPVYVPGCKFDCVENEIVTATVWP